MVGFTIRILSVKDNEVKFSYKSCPKMRASGFYCEETGWRIFTESSPECNIRVKRLYTVGYYTENNDAIMYCDLQEWARVEKTMAKYNESIGRTHKTVHKICPRCYKINKSILPISKIMQAPLTEECYACQQLSDIQIEPTLSLSYINNSGDTPFACVYLSNNPSDIFKLTGKNIRMRVPTHQRYKELPELCSCCGQDSGIKQRIIDYTPLQYCSNCFPSIIRHCPACDTFVRTSKFIPWGESIIHDKHIFTSICACCNHVTACSTLSKPLIDNYHGSYVSIPLCVSCADTPPNEYLDPELSYNWKSNPIEAIHLFKNKPYVINLTQSKSTIPFMGMEIEIVLGEHSKISKGNYGHILHINSAIKKFNSIFSSPFNTNITVCKHDGSVYDGTEIVVNPLSIEAWRTIYKSGILNSIFEHADLLNTNLNEVGGHIHLSKDACTKSQIYSISKFVNENLNFISDIAGRKIAIDSRWCAGRLDTTPIKMVRVSKYSTKTRYSAINVTPTTIEHRYFSTPRCANDVMRNIEFVHALWAASRASFKNLSCIETFRSYVLGKYKDYPFLEKWFKENLKSYKQNKLYLVGEFVCQEANAPSEQYPEVI